MSVPPPPPPDMPGPEPAREAEPRHERSWWRFRRHGGEEEPRLGPAEPTGFDWIGEPQAEATADEPPAAGEAPVAEQPPPAEPPPAEPPQPAPPPVRRVRCPACRAEVDEGAFCEECGADLAAPTAAPVASPAPAGLRAHSPADPRAYPPEVGRRADADDADPDGMFVLAGTPALAAETMALPHGGICTECGGTYDPDGYCENCGAKAADPRHHSSVTLTPWLAGVCDRGVRHPSNEDALALRGGDAPTGQRAAIVVCDGVSSAPRSAEASAAAAEAAAEVLATSQAHGVGGVEAALIGALGRRLEAAADAAADAVAAVTAAMRAEAGHGGADGAGGPSCTFVAAVVQDGRGVVGNVGDSRAYWFPDAGDPVCLTRDDSWAAEQIRGGASREEAEAGPHAHTITRWIGDDSPDHRPSLTTLDLSKPGWLLLCSDGLWNYASEPTALEAVVRASMAAVPPERAAEQPATELAAALVAWAKAQGGHDNITVGLAYLLPQAALSSPPASGVPSQTSSEEE